MDKIRKEIINAVTKMDSFQDICVDLVKLFFTKGMKDGLAYFRIIMTEMSIYTWVEKEKVGEDFFDLNIVPDERINELVRTENLLLTKQIQNRVTEDEFYSTLWDRLWDDILLPTTEDRVAFFYLLWGDSRVPYYQIDEVKALDENKFEKLLGKIAPAIHKGEFILNANIEYKSQLAMQLINLTRGMSEDEQSVFWGVLIGQLKSQIDTLLQELSKENKK